VIEQVIIGVANGSVYAALGLALVLIYRATGVVNFAQGEMATLTAYLTYTMVIAGVPWPLAVVVALVASALLGAGIFYTLVRPIRGRAKHTNIAIVTLALFTLLASVTLSIWTGIPKAFPPIFGSEILDIGGVRISSTVIVVLIIAVVTMVLVTLFFRFTKLGLGLQGATSNETAARIVGIEPNRVYMVGWALAAAVGGVAGILSANLLLLEPTMMVMPMILAFAAMAVGGLSSPLGAVLGGLILGLAQSLLGTYVDGAAALRTPIAFLLLVLVLLIRPQGFFGRGKVVRP
jgi:branched-chain amino acid transport system permease protein